MRQAGVRGAALVWSAVAVWSVTAAGVAAQAAVAPVRRDVLVALPAAGQPGEFEIAWWTSAGAPQGFAHRLFVASGTGTVTRFGRHGADGDHLASADLPPAGQAGSAIYTFVSPFTRTMRNNQLPLRTSYAVAPPELITDFEYDPPDPANPLRSDSLVVVGRDTATGGNWLRRVPLAGGIVTRVNFGSGARHLALAIDPRTGDIHVADDRGLLHSFDAALALITFNLLTPAIACQDLAWQADAARPDPLLAVGHDATNGDALFRVTPGTVPLAVPVALLPAAGSSASIDGSGDGYLLLDAAAGGRDLWAWDELAGEVRATSLPRGPYQAAAWTSRCTVESIAAAPGTPIRALLAPPRVGDPGLTFAVTVPAGRAVELLGIVYSSRWTDQWVGMGPEARLIADPAAPAFVFEPLPGAGPPVVFVPRPLTMSLDGARVVAQLVWLDVARKELVTSWAANFVIGQ